MAAVWLGEDLGKPFEFGFLGKIAGFSDLVLVFVPIFAF